MKAAVILTKCKNDHALFGIRTEQREDGGWYATWAFKVSEQTAEREKFGDTKISGNIYITTEYPSCPTAARRDSSSARSAAGPPAGTARPKRYASGAATKPRPPQRRSSTP